jgi:heme exporter protein D
MKERLPVVCFLLFLFFLSATYAQTPDAAKKTVASAAKTGTVLRRDTTKLADQSLNGQFQYMLSRTRTSPEGYKMVNPNRLYALWKNVGDTLRKERMQLKNLQKKLSEQGKTVTYLKTEISGKEASLDANADKLDEIVFLGISFDKGTYNIIVWSIIGVLAIALAIVIIRSGSSIKEAKHRTQLYQEVADEYQNFKSKSVEKERKLARALQDERNKLEELMKRK